jgi:hypothetical protein
MRSSSVLLCKPLGYSKFDSYDSFKEISLGYAKSYSYDLVQEVLFVRFNERN